MSADKRNLGKLGKEKRPYTYRWYDPLHGNGSQGNSRPNENDARTHAEFSTWTGSQYRLKNEKGETARKAMLSTAGLSSQLKNILAGR